MADTPLTLTAADQALINAMIVATGPSLGDPADRKLAIDCLAEVLPCVNRAHPKLKDLIVWADRLVAIEGLPLTQKLRSDRASAHVRGHQALAELGRWRLGAALELFRNDQKGRAA